MIADGQYLGVQSFVASPAPSRLVLLAGVAELPAGHLAGPSDRRQPGRQLEQWEGRGKA